MSRESGRVRALLNAARLRHVLEASDRVELLGHAAAKLPPSTEPVEFGRPARVLLLPELRAGNARLARVPDA